VRRGSEIPMALVSTSASPREVMRSMRMLLLLSITRVNESHVCRAPPEGRAQGGPAGRSKAFCWMPGPLNAKKEGAAAF